MENHFSDSWRGEIRKISRPLIHSSWAAPSLDYVAETNGRRAIKPRETKWFFVSSGKPFSILLPPSIEKNRRYVAVSCTSRARPLIPANYRRIPPPPREPIYLRDRAFRPSVVTFRRLPLLRHAFRPLFISTRGSPRWIERFNCSLRICFARGYIPDLAKGWRLKIRRARCLEEIRDILGLLWDCDPFMLNRCIEMEREVEDLVQSKRSDENFKSPRMKIKIVDWDCNKDIKNR